jgi:hypothetical protein
MNLLFVVLYLIQLAGIVAQQSVIGTHCYALSPFAYLSLIADVLKISLCMFHKLPLYLSSQHNKHQEMYGE